MTIDAQALRDVIAAFERIPGLRYSRLYIDVKSRVVTIRGRVPSEADRQEAEHAARGIVGLRALVLQIAVATASATAPKVHAVSHKEIAAADLG